MLYFRQSNIRKWTKRMPALGFLSMAAVTAVYPSLGQASHEIAAQATLGMSSTLLMCGLVLAGGAVLGAVIFGLRRGGGRKQTVRQDGIVVAKTAAAAPHTSNGNAAAKPQLGGSNGSSLARAAATPVMGQQTQSRPSGVKLSLKKPLGAGANGKNHHRKRSFDYNRYFADLLDSVSGRTYISEFSGNVNGTQPELLPNGDGFLPGFEPNRMATAQAQSEMIANQRSFIEEQRRLIAEQSRLIEEKSRLIAEKNQLLKMQSELFEAKLL